MKTTDIGFERFEEDFYADISTAFIKPKNLDEYTQIVHPSLKQREKFFERKMPYVKDAWEHYVKKMKAEGAMINWIRQQFCKHEFELVKQNEYSSYTVTSYMCKKCGWVRTIRTW